MTSSTELLQSPARDHWQRIGPKNHHGINIPLFSLHSKNSCGIGEFPDLIPLIHWCKNIGFDVIQLLPLNDSGENSSPYSGISAFALNPIHLGLAELPNLDQFPDLQQLVADMQGMNRSQRVDYSLVRPAKDNFMREYYRRVASQIIPSEAYQKFVQENSWLPNFALFKALKIFNCWAAYSEWNESFQNITPERYQELLRDHESEITYHIFVQYLCFEQFKKVKAEAEKKGVFLKGDIPILIDRESADVWKHRNLFLMNLTAGSQADMYSDEGQNWGNPIFNWEAIENENYLWWKERLQYAGNFYHLYRLDHVVGFFRIWAIPLGHTAKDGKYIPEDEQTWLSHGEGIMREMLMMSPMLPIAEDLGVVPPEARICLNYLGICGTKVIRWERRWRKDKSFIPYDEYPKTSMTTVSTHDSQTLQEWWKLNPHESMAFASFKGWVYQPELSLQRHKEILHDSHHTGSLFHINLLQEYLALVPGMTWPNPQDERINVPGTISDTNWSYRFRPSLEEIVSNSALRQIMQDMLK